MRHPVLIPVIDQRPGQLVAKPKLCTEVMRPPSNAAVAFLRPTAGNQKQSSVASSMAGSIVSTRNVRMALKQSYR